MIGKRLRRRSKRRISNEQSKPLISITDSETTTDKWSKHPEDLKRLSLSNVQTKPLVETTTDKWSNLSEDLLRSVVNRLFEDKDFIMFRSVCQTWRSAIPTSYWKRVPWILAKRYQGSRVVLKGLSCFENTSLCSLYQTELHWRYWGSFTGWILGQHYSDYRLKLINPLTKAVIDLPPLTGLIKKGLVYHTRRADSLYPSIQVMAISHMFTGVAILDHGYKEWKVLEDPRFRNNFHTNYGVMLMTRVYVDDFVDAIWYKEHAAAIRANGTIVFFDEAKVVVSLPPPTHVKSGVEHDLYMVESSGELLIVEDHQGYYKVYKLNMDTGEWIPVRDLGRHSLFVGQSYSISRWMTGNDTGNTWKPSCIYKLTDCYNVTKQRKEFDCLGHVSELNGCYDYIWYMPAVGSE